MINVSKELDGPLTIRWIRMCHLAKMLKIIQYILNINWKVVRKQSKYFFNHKVRWFSNTRGADEMTESRMKPDNGYPIHTIICYNNKCNLVESNIRNNEIVN